MTKVIVEVVQDIPAQRVIEPGVAIGEEAVFFNGRGRCNHRWRGDDCGL
jgi:hypothetical protein